MTDHDRIETLETQVRTLKKMLFGLVALVAVGSLLAATALPKVPDVIKAKAFEVVNDDGDVLVVLDYLTADGRDIGYAMTGNSDGSTLVNIGAGPGGGIITTRNHKGRDLVELGINGTDGLIRTMNGKDGLLVEIGSTKSSEGAIYTENGKGGVLVAIASTATGKGAITTEDGRGRTTSKLP